MAFHPPSLHLHSQGSLILYPLLKALVLCSVFFSTPFPPHLSYFLRISPVLRGPSRTLDDPSDPSVLLGSLTPLSVTLNTNACLVPPLNAAPPPRRPRYASSSRRLPRGPLPDSERQAPRRGASKSTTPQALIGRPHLSDRRLRFSHQRLFELPTGICSSRARSPPDSDCRPPSPGSTTSSGPERPSPAASFPQPPPGPPPAPRLPF